MTQSIDISQLSAKWPELLTAMHAGDEVIVTDHNVPQARLLPVATSERPMGLHPGDFRMAPDFNDPMPEEFWLGEE